MRIEALSVVIFGVAAAGLAQAPKPASPGPIVVILDAPYSGEQVTTVTAAADVNASPIQSSRGRIYRDSKGRVRREFMLDNNGAWCGLEIDDPVTGYTYRTAIGKRAMIYRSKLPGIKSRRRASELGAIMVQNANNPGSLGMRELSGFAVYGSETAGEKYAFEAWTSPDLMTPMLTKSTRAGREMTTQLTVLNRAEPDPSLFTVPSGYTIVDADQ